MPADEAQLLFDHILEQSKKPASCFNSQITLDEDEKQDIQEIVQELKQREEYYFNCDIEHLGQKLLDRENVAFMETTWKACPHIPRFAAIMKAFDYVMPQPRQVFRPRNEEQERLDLAKMIRLEYCEVEEPSTSEANQAEDEQTAADPSPLSANAAQIAAVAAADLVTETTTAEDIAALAPMDEESAPTIDANEADATGTTEIAVIGDNVVADAVVAAANIAPVDNAAAAAASVAATAGHAVVADDAADGIAEGADAPSSVVDDEQPIAITVSEDTPAATPSNDQLDLPNRLLDRPAELADKPATHPTELPKEPEPNDSDTDCGIIIDEQVVDDDPPVIMVDVADVSPATRQVNFEAEQHGKTERESCSGVETAEKPCADEQHTAAHSEADADEAESFDDTQQTPTPQPKLPVPNILSLSEQIDSAERGESLLAHIMKPATSGMLGVKCEEPDESVSGASATKTVPSLKVLSPLGTAVAGQAVKSARSPITRDPDLGEERCRWRSCPPTIGYYERPDRGRGRHYRSSSECRRWNPLIEADRTAEWRRDRLRKAARRGGLAEQDEMDFETYLREVHGRMQRLREQRMQQEQEEKRKLEAVAPTPVKQVVLAVEAPKSTKASETCKSELTPTKGRASGSGTVRKKPKPVLIAASEGPEITDFRNVLKKTGRLDRVLKSAEPAAGAAGQPEAKRVELIQDQIVKPSDVRALFEKKARENAAAGEVDAKEWWLRQVDKYKR